MNDNDTEFYDRGHTLYPVLQSSSGHKEVQVIRRWFNEIRKHQKTFDVYLNNRWVLTEDIDWIRVLLCFMDWVRR